MWLLLVMSFILSTLLFVALAIAGSLYPHKEAEEEVKTPFNLCRGSQYLRNHDPRNNKPPAE